MTRRGMRKSIRTVSEIFTRHDLSWNMLPILLNNKHSWSSQVENDHQPSVRAGLHTQTHTGVTALRRSYSRGTTQAERRLQGGISLESFIWMRNEGWRGWWRTNAFSFRLEDVKSSNSARAHGVCVWEKTQWRKGKDSLGG